MTEDIFIGVDGGATKTTARIEDDKGGVLGIGHGASANIRLSVSTSWDSIFTAIHQALKKSSISLRDTKYAFHVGLGLAGTEIPSACEKFLTKPHPFATLALRSDAYSACLGAHMGEDGEIIIVGTGVIGLQICNMVQTQVNGWGFPHADEGGGAWLGMRAIGLVLQWQDGREDPSPMLEKIFAHFEKKLLQLVIWANQANSTQFAEIAPYVVEFSKKNDPHAKNLITQSAKEIQKVANALEKYATKPLPCCLLGSIAPYIEPHLEKNVRKRISPPQADAAKGAIFMIKNELSSQR